MPDLPPPEETPVRPLAHLLTDTQHADLAHAVMRRQARLGLQVASVFLLFLFGLPLVNLYFPAAANTLVLGFPATWLFLGVLFFPVTWLLSAYFIRESNRIEDECSDWRTVLNIEAGEETGA